MTITQRLATLLGGVSQRPQTQRTSGQADAQTNASNHPQWGLMKRPPLEYVANMDFGLDGTDDGFVHPIEVSPTQRYLAVVNNGTLRVVDVETGADQQLLITKNDAYLMPASVLDGTAGTDAPDDWDSGLGLSPEPLEDHTPSGAGAAGTEWQLNGTAQTAYCVQDTGDGPSRILGNLAATPGASDATYTLIGFTPDSANYQISMDTAVLGTPAADHDMYWIVRGNASDRSGYALRLRFAPYAIGSGDLQRIFMQVGTMSAAGNFTSLSGDLISVDVFEGRIGLRVTDYFIEGIADGVTICSGTDTDQLHASAGLIGLRFINMRSSTPTFSAFTLANLTVSYDTVSTAAPTFRAVQVGDSTVIVNTDRAVAMRGDSSADPEYTALVYITQADYGTQYRLTLNGYQLSIGSPEGVTAQTRRELDTTQMAAKLKEQIEAIAALNDFVVTQYGSSLLISLFDGSDFTISADDGLADNGLRLIKGSVQNFADLPTKAPADYVVEVTGAPETNFDNYFVKFDVTNTATNEGVWRECVKPGEPTALNAATLPHALTYRGSLIPEAEAEGIPPFPFVAPGGGTLIQERWDSVDIFGRGLLTSDGDHLNAALGDANGIQSEYTIWFDVDSRGADPSNLGTISLQYETGAIGSDVWSTAVSRTYGPELLLNGESLTATLTRSAGERIRIQLDYASGSTPTKKLKVYTAQSSAAFTVSGGNQTPNQHWAIEYWQRAGKNITFPPTAIYPTGTTITVNVDGTDFTFLPEQDISGEDLATEFATLIDADATFLATATDGVILITRADAASPEVVGFTDFVYAQTFHDPDLEMVPDALIGYRLENLTDRSSGIITGNTLTTITVTEMTGGVDNLMQKGDRVRVVLDSNDPYFVYGPADWAVRKAGDLTSNPLPYFVDRKLQEVLYHKGRLGLLLDNHVLLSEVGQPYNFFRTTVTQLLDTDPIDATPMGEAVHFHSAALWNGEMILWAGHQQYPLLGEPILSPKTVSLPKLTDYPSEAIRPVTVGKNAYFIAKRSGYTQVYSYEMQENVDKPQARATTAHVSRYLPGDVVLLAGDENAQALAVVTDADTSKVFVLQFDRTTGQESWTTWQLPLLTVIAGLCFMDGKLVMLTDRTDGCHIETIDLDSNFSLGLLDRRVEYEAGEGLFDQPGYEGTTRWTLPYLLLTNGTMGTPVVVNATTGEVLTSVHATTSFVTVAGDQSAVPVIIGIAYTFSHTLSTMYPRNQQDDRPRISGRLQLSRMRLSYEDTRDFTVTVTPLGRTARTYTVDLAAAADGTLSFPVSCENKQATITITNATSNPCRFTDLEWEGVHYQRSRSI